MQEEEEPSPNYVKGYNHGYQLAQHEPALLNKLIQAPDGNVPSDYTQALRRGKEQFEHEKLVAEMKNIRERHKHTLRRKR